MKHQSKKSRMDESLGIRRGKESSKEQSYSSRRHESEGMMHHSKGKMGMKEKMGMKKR